MFAALQFYCIALGNDFSGIVAKGNIKEMRNLKFRIAGVLSFLACA